ncbi:cell wall-active antibiotics response protein LiaF [Paenibacillus sp. FSL M8-0334]|uniref:cell wall-active antibiotics response protein LiaF n=1 Tax=Paenibacillus sp. FSL M8-0334 TaxID=2921623 RepID=UPI004046C0A5
MTMSKKGWSQLFGGLFLIGIGVLFFLNQLGFINVSIGYLISTFWPVILIWFGLQSLIFASGAGVLWGALVPILLGLYFLGRNLGYVWFSFGDLIKFAIPVALILFGLQVILQPRNNRRPPEPPPAPEPDRRQSPIPPEPPEAVPLDSSLDEVFERKFGKPQQEPKQEHTDHANHRDHTAASGRRGYRYDDTDPHYGYNEEEGHRYYEDREDPNRSGARWSHHDTVNKSAFIGDVHMGKEYFSLKPTNISQFIGDTVLDLTKAQIPYGETRINISGFIGDVKVFVPNDSDLGIHVSTSSFIGDMKVLDQKEGSGFMSSSGIESPYYREAGKRIRIHVSVFIGDIKVNRVG